MGVKRWWQRRRPARIVDAPEHPVELACARLAVHTAESMVVVTTTVAGLEALVTALRDGGGTTPPEGSPAAGGGARKASGASEGDKSPGTSRPFSGVRLSAPGKRPVSFVPSTDPRQVPALDPDRGWIVPLTPQVRASLVATVTGETVRVTAGAWEIPGLNLGIVAED